MAIDKVTLQVLANHCRAAAENMAYTLFRTAHSTFVKETEDFTIQLSEPSCGAKLGATTIQTVTILDDEPVVTVTIANSTVGEGAGNAPVTVQAVPANGQPLSNTVTVQYAAANGTAAAGSDYTAKSGTLTFTPTLSAPQTVNVPILDDTIDEPDQTFTLGLSNVTGGTLGSPSVQTVTIQDNDPTAVVSLSNPSVTEGNSGTTNMVKIRLTPAATSAVDVDWGTVAGTATADVDYVTSSGTAHFGVGQSEAVVPVSTTLDSLVEGVETFTVQLSNPVGSTIASGTGTVKIVDGELGTDFNGDVRTDLVWREPSTASFQVWFMNGATQVGTAVTNPPTAPGFRLAGTGSFQPGGRNDMLLQVTVRGTAS